MTWIAEKHENLSKQSQPAVKKAHEVLCKFAQLGKPQLTEHIPRVVWAIRDKKLQAVRVISLFERKTVFAHFGSLLKRKSGDFAAVRLSESSEHVSLLSTNGHGHGHGLFILATYGLLG